MFLVRSSALRRFRRQLCALRWMLLAGGATAAAACTGMPAGPTSTGPTGAGPLVADSAGHLWVVTTGTGAGLYRSSDQGTTFQPILPGAFDRLVVSPDGRGIWVGDGIRAELSTDGGASFTKMSIPDAPAFDRADDARMVFAATPPEISTDGGKTLAPVTVSGPLGRVQSVVFAADDTAWAFGQSVARSTDGGATFDVLRSVPVASVRVPPDGPLWVQPTSGQCDDGPSTGYCVLAADGSLTRLPALPASMQHVFLGHDAYVDSRSGSTETIERSQDGGATFSPTGAWPTCGDGTEPLDGTADPVMPGVLYVGGSCPDGTSLWVSIDGGATFRTISGQAIVGQ